MPDFDLADVLGIISAQTVVAIAIGGLLVAVYLWSTTPRVTTSSLIRVWTIGIAFLAIMGAGRWAALSSHWEAWIGSALLWSLFLGVAQVSIVLSRRYRRWRHPTQMRENGI